jgi:hypothetical protein
MAKNKEITQRVIRQTKATKRLFREIISEYEERNYEKTIDNIADDCFELGVTTKIKQLRDEKNS